MNIYFPVCFILFSSCFTIFMTSTCEKPERSDYNAENLLSPYRVFFFFNHTLDTNDSIDGCIALYHMTQANWKAAPTEDTHTKKNGFANNL